MNTSQRLLQMAQYIWNITLNQYWSTLKQESNCNLVALCKGLISVALLRLNFTTH